ncbi:MAG TPA: hypothetical protein VLA02_19410 [Reyranella sp.]|nr:hypothetical protein [Reyranella sp.]
MTTSKLFSVALLLAACAVMPAVHAQQTGAPSAPPAGTAPGGPPPGASSGGPGGPGGPAGPTSSQGYPYPVIMVTSVEVLRSERSGGMDIVRARGVVTSPAWDTPHLVPITQGPGIDGMLDLLFLATASPIPSPPGSFMTVEAILPIGHGHPYKGVRVRSGTNVIALKTLPGFAEVPAPKADCAKCVGKYFVAKGATAPAGVAADNIVRQEDLPWDLRVIGPTQGIAGYSVNPNRLTLVLTEDGRIADAAWD